MRLRDHRGPEASVALNCCCVICKLLKVFHEDARHRKLSGEIKVTSVCLRMERRVVSGGVTVETRYSQSAASNSLGMRLTLTYTASLDYHCIAHCRIWATSRAICAASVLLKTR